MPRPGGLGLGDDSWSCLVEVSQRAKAGAAPVG